MQDYSALIQSIIHDSKGEPKAVFVVSDKKSYYDVYLFTKSLFDFSEANCRDYNATIYKDNTELRVLGIDPSRSMPSIMGLQPTILIITTDFEDDRILQYLAFKTRGSVYFSPLPSIRA